MGAGSSGLYRIGWEGGEPELVAEAPSAAVSPVAPKLAWADGGTLWVVEPGQEKKKVLETRGRLSLPEWSSFVRTARSRL